MSDSRDLAPGATIAAKYRVVSVLGRGGMGVVYRATQIAMARDVAVKVLRRELTDDPRARVRFEREARVASALAHPAAVAVHDFAADGATPYLAMELVEGRGLRALIEDGIDTARAIDLAAQLADVLAAAHAAGLVHRDLKPENVIVEGAPTSPRARVLDFGLAFLLAAPGAGGRMTREGVVVGTPEYLSPEQARGEEVGPPTDVYALGCLLHEMLSGRPPFSGHELDVLTKQMFAPPPPLRRETEILDLPVALDDLRRAMLDKRAAARPAAAEVRDRLIALDADPDRARARARLDGWLGPRAVRMVEATRSSSAAETASRDAELEIGVVGTLDAGVLLALRATGIHAFLVRDEEPIGESTRAIFAPGAPEDQIATLARTTRIPVLASLDRGGASELASMLRAGAADVVLQPFAAADLARKIRRVVRDRARRS